MDRRTVETVTTGAGVALGCLAAAMFIPASRKIIVDLAEERLRGFDEAKARDVVYGSGRATMRSAFDEAKKQGGLMFSELGKMLKSAVSNVESSIKHEGRMFTDSGHAGGTQY